MMTARGWLIRIAVALVLCGLYARFGYSSPLRLWVQGRIEDQIARWHYAHQTLPPELGPIVLVAVDDESIVRMNLRTPWDRKVFAQAISRISAAWPRLIAMDIVFTGETNPDSDGELAQAIAAAGNVLLATYLDPYNKPVEPLPIFAQASLGVSTINHAMEVDSVIRSTKLHYQDHYLSGSMALDVACRLLGGAPRFGIGSVQIADDSGHIVRTLPTTSNGKMRLRYFARDRDVTVVPIWQVLQSDAPLEIFRGKTVFVGLTALIFHDRHLTPLGIQPGVMLMINSLLTQLKDAAPSEVPRYLQWLALLFAVLLTAFATTRTPAAGLGIVLGALAGFAAASAWLDHVRYVWDMVGMPLLSINLFVGGLFVRATTLMWETVHLHRQASTDNLTGIANFRFFQVRLEHEIGKTRRSKSSLSLAMFDMDGFKGVNDTAGHGAGNDLLIGFVKRLQPLLKQGELFARFGGDEFCLLANCDQARAMALTESMRKAVEAKPFPTRAGDQRVTLSVGVVTERGAGISEGNALIERADAALYRSKRDGKNRVTYFEPSMLDEAPQKHRRRKEDITGPLAPQPPAAPAA
jgi:diguanylate cyclase (GGDEF)-like protein